MRAGSAASGATFPMFSIIFGDVLDALGGSPTIAALVSQVNKVALLCNVQNAALPFQASGNLNFVAAGVPVFCIPGNCILRCVLWRDWALDVDRYIYCLGNLDHFLPFTLHQLVPVVAVCRCLQQICYLLSWPGMKICCLQPCSASELIPYSMLLCCTNQ